ncbi:MAG: type secretion protein EccB, Actinobacterial, partial [Mycobacterium sp.]|nr:type secretion protein EccB, Actinobacterial [Mycobacterium sp.]
MAAGIVVALAAVLATLRPQSDWGGSSLVMVRDTGAVYVRVGDLVHPVLNLTSA